MFGILTENQSYFLKIMEVAKIIRLCTEKWEKTYKKTNRERHEKTRLLLPLHAQHILQNHTNNYKKCTQKRSLEHSRGVPRPP